MRLLLQSAALLLGEAVLFFGLLTAWFPLAFISLGLQLVAGALLSREPGDDS